MLKFGESNFQKIFKNEIYKYPLKLNKIAI